MTIYQSGPKNMVGSATYLLTQQSARPGTRRAAVCPVTQQLVRQSMCRDVLYKVNSYSLKGTQSLYSLFLYRYFSVIYLNCWRVENSSGSRSHYFCVTVRPPLPMIVCSHPRPPQIYRRYLSLISFLSFPKLKPHTWPPSQNY